MRSEVSQIAAQNKGAQLALGTVAKHRRRLDETLFAGVDGAYIGAGPNHNSRKWM
jgi:hypothetical protein